MQIYIVPNGCQQTILGQRLTRFLSLRTYDYCIVFQGKEFETEDVRILGAISMKIETDCHVLTRICTTKSMDTNDIFLDMLEFLIAEKRKETSLFRCDCEHIPDSYSQSLRQVGFEQNNNEKWVYQT